MPTVITVTQPTGAEAILCTADLVYATDNGSGSDIAQENVQTNTRPIAVTESLSEIEALDDAFVILTRTSGADVLLNGFRIKLVEDVTDFRRVSYEGTGSVNTYFEVTETITEIADAINSTAGSSFDEISIVGNAAVGSGLMTLASKTSSVTFSGGASEIIPIQLPAGALIIATQLRNDTLLVGAGATDYTAAWNGGGFPLSGTIKSNIAFAKNTKVNSFYNVTNDEATNLNIVDIVLVPDAGTLDSGTVTAVVYYWQLTSITDAP